MQKITVIAGNDGLQKKNEGSLTSGLMQAGKHRNASTKGGAVSSIDLPGLPSFLPILSDHIATLTEPGAIGNRQDRQACAMDLALGCQERTSIERTQDVKDRSVGEWTSDVLGSVDEGFDAGSAEESVPAGQGMSAAGLLLRKGYIHEDPANSILVKRHSGRVHLSGFGINQPQCMESAAGVESVKNEASRVKFYPSAGTAVSENDATTAQQIDDQAQPSGCLFNDGAKAGESRSDLFVERFMGLMKDAGMKGETVEKNLIRLHNKVNIAKEEGATEHTTMLSVNRPVNPSLKPTGMDGYNGEADEHSPLGHTQGLLKTSVDDRVETMRAVLQGPAGGKKFLDAALSGSGVGPGTGQGHGDRNPSVQDKTKGWAGSPESAGMNLFYLSTVNGYAAESSAPALESNRAEDLMAQIQQARKLLTRDSGRVRITLSPPSLGTLDMEVVVRQNKVEVIMRVDNVLVQQVLQANADELKANLQGQGLSFEGLNILNGGTTNRQDYAFANNGTLWREGQGRGGTEREEDGDQAKSIEILAERPQQRYDSDTGMISLYI
jgi:hypothetical protein